MTLVGMVEDVFSGDLCLVFCQTVWCRQGSFTIGCCFLQQRGKDRRLLASRKQSGDGGGSAKWEFWNLCLLGFQLGQIMVKVLVDSGASVSLGSRRLRGFHLCATLDWLWFLLHSRLAKNMGVESFGHARAKGT